MATSRKVHFIGIGGVGMAALAALMKSAGDNVSGCDLCSTARTRWLESLGIPVAIGHDPSHVEGADLVVATPAVSRSNPELLAAKAVRFRGEMLAEIVGRRDSIAVCGSHGKTTTSTFVAKLLRALGEDVSWAIGGETGDFPVAGTGSATGPLVVEADESDGTLALYHARTLVVTNCEYDHPDHFKTPEDYFACYETAKRQAGTVIESEELSTDGFPAAISDVFVSLAPHNVRNARAAIEVALRRGHPIDAIAAALPDVVSALPDRRFQLFWPNGLTPPLPHVPNPPLVYTDYAHHPTEMKCAVAMAREKCKGRLRVLFQPHRYSRTKALLDSFSAAFASANEVVLCPTYAAFENPVEGGDVADLYAACRKAFAGHSPRLFLARTCEEAWRHAFLEMGNGDVTLLLGAGDIIKLVPKVVSDMSEPVFASRVLSGLSGFSFFRTGGRTVGGGERRVVGMGSNLWISDLTTDAEYYRLDESAPAGKPGASLGIPWMAGIPGTIGGWVKMNAGAFGHSISELVSGVKVDGKWILKADCGFGYRTSSIRGVIEDVNFIVRGSGDAAQGESPEGYLARRRKFPARCCGSVFKNPPGDHAGRLLEAVGAKGLRVGGAYVWQEHANVIVADEGATSSDILALARLMRERVRFRLGVELEPEIVGLGEGVW